MLNVTTKKDKNPNQSVLNAPTDPLLGLNALDKGAIGEGIHK